MAGARPEILQASASVAGHGDLCCLQGSCRGQQGLVVLGPNNGTTTGYSNGSLVVLCSTATG